MTDRAYVSPDPAGAADATWQVPTVRLTSRFGCSLLLPTGSFFVDEPSSGPGTEQIGLPGDILISLIPENRVQHISQLLEWPEGQARRFINDRAGELITQGRISSPGKDVYSCLVGFMGLSGEPRIVASVGAMSADGQFMGLLVLWPVTDPKLEPDVPLVRRVVASLDFGESVRV